MTLSTKVVAATAGLMLGGLGSFVMINAIKEGKRGVDSLFSWHDNSKYYTVDILSAVACAGIGWLMASICGSVSNQDNLAYVRQENVEDRARRLPRLTVIEPSAPSFED